MITVCGGIFDFIIGIVACFLLWILGLGTAGGSVFVISLMVNLIYRAMIIIKQYRFLSSPSKCLYLLRSQPLERRSQAQHSRPIMIGPTLDLWLRLLMSSCGVWWPFYIIFSVFTPQASMSVRDLDQVTALMGGAITFVFGLARFCRNKD